MPDRTWTACYQKEEMTKLSEIRDGIKKHPGMYIGKTSIANFEHWLMGVMAAEAAHNIPDEQRIFPKITEFESWLKERGKEDYRGERKSYGYTLRVSSNNDACAFLVWLRLYDEFTGVLPPDEFGVGMRVTFRNGTRRGTITEYVPDMAPNIWHVVWDEPNRPLYGSDWYKQEDLTPVK
jgi:hypothetical protein